MPNVSIPVNTVNINQQQKVTIRDTYTPYRRVKNFNVKFVNIKQQKRVVLKHTFNPYMKT